MEIRNQYYTGSWSQRISWPGTVEVTEHGEIPVVSKDARVVEEINLGKEVEENEETIRGTVRNTEVRTEEIPGEETKKEQIWMCKVSTQIMKASAIAEAF